VTEPRRSRDVGRNLTGAGGAVWFVYRAECSFSLSAEAIKFVSGECKAGKSVAELCEAGDKLITEKLAKVYKGKKVEKGIAFPTCVSINNCCGHFSPLKEDSIELKDGDVCKM
jgi:methionine aminopeptidase